MKSLKDLFASFTKKKEEPKNIQPKEPEMQPLKRFLDAQEQMYQNAQYNRGSAQSLYNRHHRLGHGVHRANIQIRNSGEIGYEIVYLIQGNQTNEFAEALQFLRDLFHHDFLSVGRSLGCGTKRILCYFTTQTLHERYIPTCLEWKIFYQKKQRKLCF